MAAWRFHIDLGQAMAGYRVDQPHPSGSR